MSHMHISDTWRSRWVESKHKSDYGKFVLSAGKFYGDAEKDKGECWFIYYRHQIIDTGLFEFVVSSVLHYIMLWIIRQGRGYCLWRHFLCSTELQACYTIWYLLFQNIIKPRVM